MGFNHSIRQMKNYWEGVWYDDRSKSSRLYFRTGNDTLT